MLEAIHLVAVSQIYIVAILIEDEIVMKAVRVFERDRSRFANAIGNEYRLFK